MNIKNNMVIYIDIDETICHSPYAPDYKVCHPIKKNIDIANKLYDSGHTIVYWTARGMTTKINWRKQTIKQFKEWGVKYHKLKMKKPVYDVFIDDKNINSKNWNILKKFIKK